MMFLDKEFMRKARLDFGVGALIGEHDLPMPKAYREYLESLGEISDAEANGVHMAFMAGWTYAIKTRRNGETGNVNDWYRDWVISNLDSGNSGVADET
jgi:hypothetical protein